MDQSNPTPAVGDHYSSQPIMMTRERMRWYCDALETAASPSGEFIVADPTIHSDDAYAWAQGLSGIIADGMLSTNYISSLLYRHFGLPYLAGGELVTKYIRPVYEDEIVQAHGQVVAVAAGRVELKVWADLPQGQPVTVGTASVPLEGGL
ncbi:MAG: MaoC family dehydratase [Propionibacteriaceae bacterium]|jgi:hypothetical protein|nr:MaoC family dehydratase [Propionibacteriaceae bacterium]